MPGHPPRHCIPAEQTQFNPLQKIILDNLENGSHLQIQSADEDLGLGPSLNLSIYFTLGVQYPTQIRLGRTAQKNQIPASIGIRASYPQAVKFSDLVI
jgi:hypothetical protein